MYEVWGLDNTPSDMGGGSGHFRETCPTLKEAREAQKRWQSGGKAAWVENSEAPCGRTCYDLEVCENKGYCPFIEGTIALVH